MRKFTVTKNDEGQRLIKYSSRILDKAPMSVIRKALRKKNIDLNKKKADGSEILKAGDEVQIWFSDDTFSKFMSASEEKGSADKKQVRDLKEQIVYEDENVLIINKPAGILTQSDDSKELSLNDILLQYFDGLSENRTFKPSICNRLDRNTSGMVIAGKTIRGLQEMNALIKSRAVKKYYNCIVIGELQEDADLKAWLKKDKAKNSVKIYDHPAEGAVEIETVIHPLKTFKRSGVSLSLIEVELVTGRPHQIRAHMSHIGHPLIGDKKYGSRESIRLSEKFAVKRQMLHAVRLEFPELGEEFSSLSGKVISTPLPPDMKKLMNG